MLVAASVRQLDEAQPVASGDEAHRLGIDGDRAVAESHVVGKVFLVEMNGHSISSVKFAQVL